MFPIHIEKLVSVGLILSEISVLKKYVKKINSKFAIFVKKKKKEILQFYLCDRQPLLSILKPV